MEAKTVELRGVGTILIERSRRAKRINLTVRPVRGARVAVPLGVSFASAERFARSKADWLKKHLAEMKRLQQAATTLAQSAPIDRSAARQHLITRLDQLAQRYGFTYNRVSVKNQKTRWGSCSAKNNINLNINLVRLPDDLIDYTLLHELVHTRIKNHSQRFWDQLDKLLGDTKKLDKKLNKYRVLLT